MEQKETSIPGTTFVLINTIARPDIDMWLLLDEVTGRTTLSAIDGLSGMKHLLQRHIMEYSKILKYVVELEEARQQ